MIICFSGTPGSGKSYEAVVKILDNLRLGRVVYTNIEGFDDPACKEMIKTVTGFGDYELATHLFFIPEHQVKEFWKHCKSNSLIVIDEVHNFFNARDWQKAENRALGNWASTHRHHGYDVVFLTQHIEKVDGQTRSLIEWTYFFRKVNFLGGFIKKKYICYSYMGDEHKGRALGKNVRTYNPKIFLCYKSLVTKDMKELNIMTHFNILKHPVFFLIPIVLITMIYMVFFKSSIGTGDLFGVNRAEKLRLEAIEKSKTGKSDVKIVKYEDVMKNKESKPVKSEKPNRIDKSIQGRVFIQGDKPENVSSSLNISAPVVQKVSVEVDVYIGIINGRKAFKTKSGGIRWES